MVFIVLVLALIYTLFMGYMISGWNEAIHLSAHSESLNQQRGYLNILIPFSNGDESSLGELMTELHAQTASSSDLQIIVIDDRDGSVLDTIPLPGEGSWQLIKSRAKGKKQALNTGMSLVNHGQVLTLDADIRLPAEWFTRLQEVLIESARDSMLILPVRAQMGTNWASAYAHLDFMSLIGVTFSMAAQKRPVMANGAQLLYSQAYARWDEKTVSGDDVMALERIKSDGGEIAFSLDPKLIVDTEMPSSWRDLLDQRARWASKSSDYRDPDIRILGWAVLLYNVLLLILAILALLHIMDPFLILIPIGAKALMDFIFLYRVLNWSGQRKALLYFPMVFFLNMMQYPIVFVYQKLFGFEWKGRKYP